MAIKIVCYGVRDTEKEFFTSLNEKFGYELVLVEELLTHDNINTAQGAQAVMLRANCVADKQNLDKMKEFGIKYVLTRTVGVNHIDVDYGDQLGFKMARVPFYSPNAVSELAVALAVGFLRNTFYMANKMRQKNFKVDDFMFAKEIRNSTIGVIGTGRIGMEAAKAFKGMGAKVLGYDIYPNDANKAILDYVSLDELLAQSDLITLHSPYIPGQNDNMINKDTIAKMKKSAIIINAARGELINPEDLLAAIKSGHIKGAALDTLQNESQIFFKDFEGRELPIKVYEELHQFYPRVIFTPHVGSYTDEAVKNMVETSYENLAEFEKSGQCKNIVSTKK
ncbi:2-hydroxyacid dehydrogenase [Spiroplasma platyhelix]|uniref:Lactate dehydrogenase n=1 Tax=Spiroplasma platyhelix PALS-1 TaxID=1276218 RepID=A0A846TTB1_9MOLU|nr:2-hydroxyacid dehydrogenase [Spiroplasma platyhelix]MBE4704373.1 Phenyllactate dehydrogenase [Spiroplasma platyhelix PALS-1]NKE38745.1 lactate dehydrogenase [Spiroplasma platyhelix PALS-1]UJB28956.1 D-lactate dehydrogenase [Spiroplasma platyhelix PALS-1]